MLTQRGSPGSWWGDELRVDVGLYLGKIWVAVFRNKSRADHWSPLVHWGMKIAIIPVWGLTERSVP